MRIVVAAVAAFVVGVVVVGLPAVGGVDEANACSITGSFDDEFAYADMIFVGTATLYDGPGAPGSTDDIAVWDFAVEDVVKGDPAKHQAIVASTRPQPCPAWKFEGPGRYVVWGTRASEVDGLALDEMTTVAHWPTQRWEARELPEKLESKGPPIGKRGGFPVATRPWWPVALVLGAASAIVAAVGVSARRRRSLVNAKRG